MLGNAWQRKSHTGEDMTVIDLPQPCSTSLQLQAEFYRQAHAARRAGKLLEFFEPYKNALADYREHWETCPECEPRRRALLMASVNMKYPEKGG